MKNVIVVLNSSAGRKQALKHKKIVLKFLLNKKVLFDFIDISKINETDFQKYDTIFVMGGDGTVNKVLPCLIDSSIRLAIFPCGTANLLASRLGINSIKDALKSLKEDNFVKIDTIKLNQKHFALRCGLGLDADIIGKTPQSVKNNFGYFSYFVAGIIFALRLKNKEYKVVVDDVEAKLSASCIIVANAANMFKNLFSVANNSCLMDSKFDVFVLKTQNPILFFLEFLKILFGFKKNNSLAQYFNAQKLRIQNSYCLMHIDGEKIKLNEDLNFEILNKSINVYCGEGYVWKK